MKEDNKKFGEQSTALFATALAQENVDKNRYISVLARTLRRAPWPPGDCGGAERRSGRIAREAAAS